jgi:2'-5' RNA ligase
MESKEYDVVLIPEQSLAQNAMELSKGFESYGTRFILDQKNFYPHLSLYMLRLSAEGLQEALASLNVIASNAAAITATAFHYHYTKEYLDIEYTKSTELTVLQEEIITALNPIRNGLRENDKIRLLTATGEERENILNFGYRSVGDQFHPHLTFTRFNNPQEGILETLPSTHIFTGTYISLGIFEMGENGTCVNPVESWALV